MHTWVAAFPLQVLQKLCDQLELSSGGAGQQAVRELRLMHQAAHFLSLAAQSTQQGLKELAAMQATSLLRYMPYIPADKALFEAGMAWRALGGKKDNMAFVFLNKFLDVCEAVEDGGQGTNAIENADLVRVSCSSLPPLLSAPPTGLSALNTGGHGHPAGFPSAQHPLCARGKGRRGPGVDPYGFNAR